MTLLEAVEILDSLDSNSTIFAAEPWTASSKAIVAEEPDGRLVVVQEEGMKYFLEVSLAREILEDWVPDVVPTPSDSCARLIQYATTDV